MPTRKADTTGPGTGGADVAAAAYVAHLRAVVDLSSDAMLALDVRGQIHAANRAAVRLLGHGAAPRAGTSLDAVMADPGEWQALFERALAGELVEGARVALQTVAGRITPAQAALLALRDERGRVVGCTVALRELSEQVFAQQTLAESERRVRRAEALALTGSFVVDGQRRSVQWSEGMYRIHGAHPEDFAVTLENQLALVHDEDRPAVAAMVAQALAGDRPAGLDHRLNRADGVSSWVFTAAEPVLDADGRVLGISGVCQDITARMASEAALHEALAREHAVSDELRRVDRLKDEFLATVSHELRTPLTSIVGFAAVLDAMAPEHTDIVQRIERNAREMHRLIQGLLDQARLESGRVALEPRRLLLAESVADLLTQYETVLGGVEVTTDVDGAIAVHADPHAFERILGNLLGNAVKYAPGSPIAISATQDVGTVTVAVADQGPGIPEAHQPRLFEPYYRTPGTGGTRGSGFGLSIVRRYVEMNGGRVWCRSEPGRGSTFLFTLPAAAEPN